MQAWRPSGWGLSSNPMEGYLRPGLGGAAGVAARVGSNTRFEFRMFVVGSAALPAALSAAASLRPLPQLSAIHVEPRSSAKAEAQRFSASLLPCTSTKVQGAAAFRVASRSRPPPEQVRVANWVG